jgi:TetR/AcrR family transcriptional regulator, transcriptional repressor for nem operon
VREAFRRLFLSFVERPEAERARGCLLVNSAMERAPHEPQTGRAIAQHLKTLEGTFLRALERAREAGQLEAKRELRPLARYLVGALQGLIVMAKGQPDRRVLRDIVDVSLSVLDARG